MSSRSACQKGVVQSIVGQAASEPSSALENYSEDSELLCIRIPAFSCFYSGLDSRLNGLGPLISSRFDQTEFVICFYLGPSENGDEFGMGNGFIHKDFIIQSAIFCVFSR